MRLDDKLVKELGILALGTRMRLLIAIQELRDAKGEDNKPTSEKPRAVVDLTVDVKIKTERPDQPINTSQHAFDRVPNVVTAGTKIDKIIRRSAPVQPGELPLRGHGN